ncbi:tRNA (adenosine(37)-N6)-dimethylallyltransferase MiaA [Patescibacteria group bacterium]|nr:tRNA (adenosine(37)-N6)-dimethylallyltransferase MiaA [Patescibacteria group bacterium]
MKNKPINLPKLVVILGSTASGKTELAIKLAKKFSGEILCADSRTIYQGLNIGTAKPLGERLKINGYLVTMIENIPHHMIDIIKLDTEFTLAQFKTMALNIITSINQRNKIPFLVGGTGLYISAIVDNFKIPHVPPDKKLRKKIEKMIAVQGLNYTFNELIKLDPGAKAFVQNDNPRRIIRALEVCLKTGQPFSKLRQKGKPLFDILQIGIKISRENLYQKINQRTDQMIEKGLIKETKKLIEKYPSDSPSFKTIGYQEIIPALLNHSSLDPQKLKKITELIKKNTRHYARRQITWFKRDQRINWVKNYRAASQVVKKFLDF